MANLKETIIPSSDLRNRYNEISRLCREEKEVVIITTRGREDTVVLSFETYQNMKSRINLLEELFEAEHDVKHKCIAPVNETFDGLRTILKVNKKLNKDDK